MRAYQQSFIVAAPKEQIWQHWSDIPSWSSWDTAIEQCYLNGEFKDGMACYLKWRGAPLMMGVIRDCKPMKSFAIEGGFLLGNIWLWHEMAEIGNGVKVSRRIEVSGPLGFALARVIRRRVVETFPAAMAKMLINMQEE